MQYPTLYLLVLCSANFFASEPLHDYNEITVRNESKHDFIIYYYTPDGIEHHTKLSSNINQLLTIYNPSPIVLQNQDKPDKHKTIVIGQTPPIIITIISSGSVRFEQAGARIIPTLEFPSQNTSSSSHSTD